VHAVPARTSRSATATSQGRLQRLLTCAGARGSTAALAQSARGRATVRPVPAGGASDPWSLDVWAGFLRTHSRITRLLNAEMEAEHGLAVREFEVLLKLESVRPGGLRMTDLVERVYLTPSGLSRLVDRMQRRGLVLRGIDSDDLRAARSRRPRPALSSTGGRRVRTVNGFGGASWSRCRPNRAPPWHGYGNSYSPPTNPSRAIRKLLAVLGGHRRAIRNLFAPVFAAVTH